MLCSPWLDCISSRGCGRSRASFRTFQKQRLLPRGIYSQTFPLAVHLEIRKNACWVFMEMQERGASPVERPRRLLNESGNRSNWLQDIGQPLDRFFRRVFHERLAHSMIFFSFMASIFRDHLLKDK